MLRGPPPRPWELASPVWRRAELEGRVIMQRVAVLVAASAGRTLKEGGEGEGGWPDQRGEAPDTRLLN